MGVITLGSLDFVEVVELHLVNLAIVVGVRLLDILGHVAVQRLSRHVLAFLSCQITKHLLHLATLHGSILVQVVLVEKRVNDLLELLLVHAQSFISVVSQGTQGTLLAVLGIVVGTAISHFVTNLTIIIYAGITIAKNRIFQKITPLKPRNLVSIVLNS